MLSRYLFRSFIHQQINSQGEWLTNNFNVINDLLVNQGIKIVALLRLTFAPYGISSYILGVTQISLIDFVIGTLAYTFNCSMQIFIGCSLYSMNGNEVG